MNRSKPTSNQKRKANRWRAARVWWTCPRCEVEIPLKMVRQHRHLHAKGAPACKACDDTGFVKDHARQQGYCSCAKGRQVEGEDHALSGGDSPGYYGGNDADGGA